MSDSLPLTEASVFFGKRKGKEVSLNTLKRWASKGIKQGNQTVVLRTCRIGGRLFTRPQWCLDFIDRLNPAISQHQERISLPVSLVLAREGLLV